MRKIRPDGSLRLGRVSSDIFQYLAASVNSASTFRPLGNKHKVAGRMWREQTSSKRRSGATARAVMTWATSGSRSSTRPLWTSASAPVSAVASRKNAHLRESASTRWTRASAQIAITRPGKPAPDPTSIQVRAVGAIATNCAESRKWRRHISGIVDRPIRLILGCHSAMRRSRMIRRASVSRETNVISANSAGVMCVGGIF